MNNISYKIILIISLLPILFFTTAAGANQRGAQAGQTIGPEKIRAAVQQYIHHHAPWNPEQLNISKINYNRPLNVPSGKIAFQVSVPKHTDWLGAIPFKVAVVVDGQKVNRITVPANIEVWSDVVMTTKPLGKYQPIGRDDIQIKKMDLARVPSSVLVNIDQVLGRRTNRNIAANCILRRDQVEIPPVIKRGDLVQVVAESPLLKISVKAMAKENGIQGDRIKVVNLRSKKAIYAQVVDEQTVRVDY